MEKVSEGSVHENGFTFHSQYTQSFYIYSLINIKHLSKDKLHVPITTYCQDPKNSYENNLI